MSFYIEHTLGSGSFAHTFQSKIYNLNVLPNCEPADISFESSTLSPNNGNPAVSFDFGSSPNHAQISKETHNGDCVLCTLSVDPIRDPSSPGQGTLSVADGGTHYQLSASAPGVYYYNYQVEASACLSPQLFNLAAADSNTLFTLIAKCSSAAINYVETSETNPKQVIMHQTNAFTLGTYSLNNPNECPVTLKICDGSDTLNCVEHSELEFDVGGATVSPKSSTNPGNYSFYIEYSLGGGDIEYKF